MSKKSLVMRGLTALFTFAFALSMALGTIVETYKATLDTFMGTQSEMTVSENSEAEPLYKNFTPPEEVLNEDGTGNSHALIQMAIDLGRQQAAEGAVLLKNNTENGQGLPLKAGSNVTLVGIRSHVPLMGSSFGVKAYGPCITLEDALSRNITDFANHITTAAGRTPEPGKSGLSATMQGWKGDEFEFEGAGFNVNPVMVAAYEELNKTYGHGNNESAEANYDPREPSVEELAAVAPDYKSSFAQYGDAAIVVISRPSAESQDFLPGSIAEGLGAEEPLALTTNERDLIATAKEASDNVIVLINSSSSVEIGDLKDDPEVDAIMWIGYPGSYGMLGIADLLCGRTSPSGGLADIFPTYNMSAPAMQNMGDFKYTNADEMITRKGGTPGAYIIEAEGLYTGYRYYETRYYDSVFGNGNATAPVGAYASNTEWNYDKEVSYGFGYGMSYTNFAMEMEGKPVYEINIDPETGAPEAYATFNVNVTNTGSVPGKTSVQIYGQAPYTQGGLEKVAVQLLNFEKSDILAPGESQVVPVKVDLQFIASYDQSHDNGDGTFGTYVLDPGTYYFAVGNGAHDALNNMMVLQGADETKMVGTGNAAMATAEEFTEDFLSRTVFSVSKTGEKISNQLDYSDWNHYQPGEVTYLTRADWAGTFPKTYSEMTLTSQDLIDDLNGKYEIVSTDDGTEVKWGQKSDLKFYQMYGVPFDDPKWDTLLDSMTIAEAQYLATYGGPSIPGVKNINLFETYMTENAGNGICVSLNASKDMNAPWTIQKEDPNGNWHPEVFANAPLVAASFNPELYRAVGEFIGVESLFTGIPILWGPGLNTHRHPYNGRNGEYYSEDPVLSGNACMEFSIGALDYGMIAAPKHFAFNDQEVNRKGVSPYMTEQRARELELRAYQIAFEASKYDTETEDKGMLGLMVSFSKIGGVECTASYGLMTEILKKEWGFKGYAVTDIYDDTDLYSAVLASGTTCFDTRGRSGFGSATKLESDDTFGSQANGSRVTTKMFAKDVTLQKALKSSAHNILYTLSQSNLTNRYNSTTHMKQFMTPLRVLCLKLVVVTGVLMLLCVVLYVVFVRRDARRRKESEVQ